jgi:hypothetical protein
VDVEVIEQTFACAIFSLLHLCQEPGEEVGVIVCSGVVPAKLTSPIYEDDRQKSDERTDRLTEPPRAGGGSCNQNFWEGFFSCCGEPDYSIELFVVIDGSRNL